MSPHRLSLDGLVVVIAVGRHQTLEDEAMGKKPLGDGSGSGARSSRRSGPVRRCERSHGRMT